jgi:hypothetical protein
MMLLSFFFALLALAQGGWVGPDQYTAVIQTVTTAPDGRPSNSVREQRLSCLVLGISCIAWETSVANRCNASTPPST